MYVILRPPNMLGVSGVGGGHDCAVVTGATAAPAARCGLQLAEDQQQHTGEADGIVTTSPDDSSSSHAAAASRHSLTQLHDSVLLKLLAAVDARSRCALMCACRQLHDHFARREHWRELVFDSADEQQGLAPQALFSLLRRSQGGCEVIQLAR